MNLSYNEMSNKHLVVFTDGSALKNSATSPAGWAVFIHPINKVFSKGMYGTNNQAELSAIKFCLYYMYKNIDTLKQYILNNNVSVYTDSQYSINVITGRTKANTNVELIKQCQLSITNLSKLGIKITFKHVMAHTGNKDFVSTGNDIVDKVARKRATEQQKL